MSLGPNCVSEKPTAGHSFSTISTKIDILSSTTPDKRQRCLVERDPEQRDLPLYPMKMIAMDLVVSLPARQAPPHMRTE